MKHAIFSLCMLTPLAAQHWEASLFVGSQSYKKLIYNNRNFEVEDTNPLALRLGYLFGKSHVGSFQASVAHQFATNSKLNIDGNISQIDYEYCFTAVGGDVYL